MINCLRAKFIAYLSILFLTACGGGSGSDSTDKTVQPPTVSKPSITLSSSTNDVYKSTEFTLTWSSIDATSCTASGDWSGIKSTSGAETLSEAMTGEKNYILDCSGSGGSTSKSVDVIVISPLPTVTVESSVYSALTGDTYTLTWSSTDATSCTASGDWSGIKAASGTESFTDAMAGEKKYTLECSGSGGNASESVEVVLTIPPLSVTVESSTESAPAGVTYFLIWSSTEVISCTASGDWSGTKATSGTASISEPTLGERTYNLTCQGERGEATGSVDVNVSTYSIDAYHGSKVPSSTPEAPENVEYFESTTSVVGQLEGLGHEPTEEQGAGKFVFNRVYHAFKHGLENGQQFGIFGSWLHSYDNNSIEGGLWVNPKTSGAHYYPTLHLAGIGDTYYACNDVSMGGGLYDVVLGDKWLTLLQISNKVLTVPGMNIGFDKEQSPYHDDNGIWIGSGWSYLNLDHPRDFKFWLSFIESYDYQGPINGYIPEHFNWIDPEKIAEGSYAWRRNEAGDQFGTFATMGSKPNFGNGNERIGLSALALGNDTYYVPVANLPNHKEREYLLAYPQSIKQTTMEDYSIALKQGSLTNTLIPTVAKDFSSIYKSTHNQLKLVEEINGEEHFHMIEPSYEVGYENSLGFVDWDFSDAAIEAKQRSENGYLYVRKLSDKWEVEDYAGDEYKNHPHSYKTEIVESPDNIVRAPKVSHKFNNYKERDTSHPDFKNWDVTGKKRYQTVLQNGAIATYVWFKFNEQPAMKTAQQNFPDTYTDEYLDELQSYIEQLHVSVNGSSTKNPENPVVINYSDIGDSDNKSFHLAKIDPAQLVQPEEKYQVGYVPVIISVYHPEEYSSNGLGLVNEPYGVCTNDEWTDTYFPDID
ncbi:hypothetical protein RGQ13_12265 [Thalassotalea psychrophila]|uniref:Ig-like domain-containing protein n=1 Tax=Thalassotalea psychrophila TaxID=3065647 RepID=A0ABY9TQ20_9GAMM|nr:hypothetical protein RGQ13_12265 [Colwelliaceae bacterium SQ149]